MIIGAQKCGTTSLFGYLRGHPQLRASFNKQVHYFDLNFHRGTGWYAEQFPRCRAANGTATLAFEASPYYLFEPRVPERVRGLLPDAKLVALLRNPVDRAFSHYHNNRRDGLEPLSFEDAIAAEPARLRGEEKRLIADPSALSPAHQRYSYLRRGVYHEQLIRWRAFFPPDQMLVLDSGRLLADPHAVLAEVLAFAGVEPWEPPHLVPHNEGGYAEAMAHNTRRQLEAYFAAHEERLVSLIGWCPSRSHGRRSDSMKSLTDTAHAHEQ
jgi:hypothetical protein